MGKIKKFNELNINGLSTNDIWVIHQYGDNDIKEIFLKKEDADKASEQLTFEYYNYYRSLNKRMTNDEFEQYFIHYKDKFKVKTLYQAIEDIKEDIYDSASHDESY